MIIVIGNGKGGVGKTTTACNLAVYLANKKSDVCVVDTDQNPLSATFISHRSKDLPKIHCIQKRGDVFETLKDIETRYEQIIVDVGGHDSPEMRSAILAATLLIVPTRPSQLDLWAIESMEELIKKAKSFNKELAVKSLFSIVSSNPKVNEAEGAKQLLIDFPNLRDVLLTHLMDRKIYRDAFTEGKGVVEMGNSKAKKEVESLCQEIFA